MIPVDYDTSIWTDFLARNKLARDYLENADGWYSTLIGFLQDRREQSQEPVLVALNGCQGSGKTTLADYLATYMSSSLNISVEVLSLDDFYLGHDARQQLARDVHPLLATRGVPGTHEISLLSETLDRLLENGKAIGTVIPRFDKTTDDRKPRVDWPVMREKPEIIILEGWCLGAQPVDEIDLVDPINDLEAAEDVDSSWRKYVNQQLGSNYLPIFSRFDIWVMLKAPSFECVYLWRLEQERKLISTKSSEAISLMNSEQLHRFVQHFERLTQNCLANLHVNVDFVYELDRDRYVVQALSSVKHR